ncbi:smad nuclear-interacting protein 1 isoform X1 [Sceloporus undulatus]|uniref:smad nuclear-interacting protein 1 isoform X1 n=1 Tax=Sceloporus undulatus TaxID=8520 RepID=UPI001C4B59D8|nr:smad nuclear-interacting protein 1 isoform X1 [Sceloporus undulatus]
MRMRTVQGASELCISFGAHVASESPEVRHRGCFPVTWKRKRGRRRARGVRWGAGGACRVRDGGGRRGAPPRPRSRETAAEQERTQEQAPPREAKRASGPGSFRGLRGGKEREDHPRRGHEERPHRDHSALEPRRERSGDRERHRDHAGRRKPRRDGHDRERGGQRFPDHQAQRELYDAQRREHRRLMEASGDEENREAKGPGGGGSTGQEAGNKEQPSFELSGALLEDTNTFRGVVIKYTEPPEARIPKKRWRLYPFKNDEVLPVMYIHRQSAYLLGRHRRIADIPIDHPSCSKQHAVFQYRLVQYTRPDGTAGRKVKPYIIDLGSGNGTFLNNQRIEPQRYYELKEKDVLKFGFSSREYVLLHESSDTTEVDQKSEEEEEEEEEEQEST